MRIAIVILATAIVLWSQEAKPYDRVRVTATSTMVNAKGVRFVYSETAEQKFIFDCNADKSDCYAPALGKTYFLWGTTGPYKCDNYKMLEFGKRVDAPGLALCLQDVEQR